MRIAVHVGLHRTGSTALQRTLGRGGELLRDAGVWFARTETVRPAVTGRLGAATAGWPAGGWRRARARAAIRDWAAGRAAEGVRRLVISDEVLAGRLDDAFGPRGPYPDAAARFGLLAEALAPWPVRAFAALRDPGEWQPSAWAFALSRRPAPRWEDAAAAALGAPRGWADLARDLDAAFPGPVVWTVPGYFADPVAVHVRLVGPVARRVGPPRRRPDNAALSGPALAALWDLRAGGGRVDAEVLGGLRRQWPLAEHGPFRPFDAAARAALSARFAADLAAIRAMGAEVIDAPSAADACAGPMDKPAPAPENRRQNPRPDGGAQPKETRP